MVVSLGGIALQVYDELDRGPVPSFEEQACSLPRSWLERTRRGYYAPRSGQISLLPKTPAYMASGGDGWSHSGPWPYLQDVPIVFYGPGIIPSYGGVNEPATTADIAPTMARLSNARFPTTDGRVLEEATSLHAYPRPRLILTIVLDGGGWNTLRMYEGDWPNLARLMAGGVSYEATVGSSPSVTPAVHSTIGTGAYPWRAGVTGVPVRDEKGEVVDAFLEGESSRFLQLPTFAERFDEGHDGRPIVGMLGYEPWHLGMIGQGAERAGGDKDHAVWLDVETNEWITNPEHYSLPDAVARTGGLDRHLRELDAEDGAIDRAWRNHEILDAPDRVEETPAFIRYHTDALLNLIRAEGYGDDRVFTDLLFTNFKQIDRVGHYFNMASPEVRDSLIETDRQLGRIVEGLEAQVGGGNYVIIVTADHGQQPDAAAVDGFGIDPNEVERDIDAEFGPISDAVWPTEVFLDDEALERQDVSVDEVARWLGDYRLEDNVQDRDLFATRGVFSATDRVFEMAIPARMLPGIECGG